MKKLVSMPVVEVPTEGTPPPPPTIPVEHAMADENSWWPNKLPDDYHTERLGKYEAQYSEAAEYLERDLQKTLFWSLRLMMQVRNGGYFANRFKKYLYTAIGFFEKPDSTVGFGVVNYTRWLAWPEREKKPFVKIDGYEFPIVTNRISVKLNAFNSNPTGGTGACYALSKKSTSPIGPGVLTAKHVVGGRLGRRVTLSCGHTGIVKHVAPGAIDAALVVDEQCHYKKMKNVIPIRHVAPFSEATFWGRQSGNVEARVKQITNTLDILDSPQLPVTIFLTKSGTGGDSGALVTDNQGVPIGIYTGAFNNHTLGDSGGLAQHAFQVAEIMDMEFYK
jgi:hypothetical protein